MVVALCALERTFACPLTSVPTSAPLPHWPAREITGRRDAAVCISSRRKHLGGGFVETPQWKRSIRSVLTASCLCSHSQPKQTVQGEEVTRPPTPRVPSGASMERAGSSRSIVEWQKWSRHVSKVAICQVSSPRLVAPCACASAEEHIGSQSNFT